VPKEEQKVAGEIVAAQQFLLDALVLGGNQWPGQTLFGARAVLGPEQTRQFGNLFGPSQLLQDAMQPLQMVAVSAQNQRWGFGAQMSEPAEDMWITA
jgi:hypothetical protein